MNYVIEQLGQKYVEPPPFHLPTCYEDATCVTPLIFVLSKGSDPTKAFFQFATDMKMDKKIMPLSLGQGQGVKVPPRSDRPRPTTVHPNSTPRAHPAGTPPLITCSYSNNLPTLK